MRVRSIVLQHYQCVVHHRFLQVLSLYVLSTHQFHNQPLSFPLLQCYEIIDCSAKVHGCKQHAEVVAQQRRDWESNLRLIDRESDAPSYH